VAHAVHALATAGTPESVDRRPYRVQRYDEAEAYFAHAAAFNDRANAKSFAARPHLSWGTMLAQRNAPGDNDRARDLLTQAQTAAAANGYANIERRAADALQHLD
jgi:hypothetical protein